MLVEKNVLSDGFIIEEVEMLKDDAQELADVNDLAWYFVRGNENRWILGTY